MKGIIYQSAFENGLEGLAERAQKTLDFLNGCEAGTDIIVLPESADMPFAPLSREEYIATAIEEALKERDELCYRFLMQQ